MFGVIVVGTDGSPSADRAVDHAIGLARASAATLHIVSAYDDGTFAAAAAAGSPMGASVAENYRVLVPKLAEVAGEIAEEAAGRADGVDTKTHAVPGDPAEALIAVAEEVGAGAIVVGNKGMGGARRFLLGSVPNRVAHHAPCHVLIVHTT